MGSFAVDREASPEHRWRMLRASYYGNVTLADLRHGHVGQLMRNRGGDPRAFDSAWACGGALGEVGGCFRRPRGSYDHPYYRYSPNMPILGYNSYWHNFSPSPQPCHRGHPFVFDVL